MTKSSRERKFINAIRISLLLGSAFGYIGLVSAAGTACTITKKVKDNLVCINDNVNYLLAYPPANEPTYTDDLIKVTAKASRQRVSGTSFKVSMTLKIKNVSGQILKIEQSGGNTVNLSDNAGISCATNLANWPRSDNTSGTPTEPDKYKTIKPGKSVIVTIRNDTGACFSSYKGTNFEVSLDLLKYEPSVGTGLPFSFSLSGIDAPEK